MSLQFKRQEGHAGQCQMFCSSPGRWHQSSLMHQCSNPLIQGSAPWSCQPQRWDWPVSSCLGLPDRFKYYSLPDHSNKTNKLFSLLDHFTLYSWLANLIKDSCNLNKTWQLINWFWVHFAFLFFSLRTCFHCFLFFLEISRKFLSRWQQWSEQLDNWEGMEWACCV